MRVSPNPVTDRAEVCFQLPKGGPGNCTVYDGAGNVVARLAEGMLAAGTHRLTWDASAAQPGIYFLQLAAAGQTRTARLTKVQ